jgi:hypothetical protein|tara:strand:+ start:6827 stop:7921 length:1095 start_codon:yes stop_codon:yes gene_type:complete
MPVKNQALTAVCYYCTNASGPVTGDDGNHNLFIVGDGTKITVAATPAEVNSTDLPGVYKVAIALGENNYDVVTLGGNSDVVTNFISPVTWTNITNADANAATAATQSTSANTQATSAAGYGSSNSTKLDTIDTVVDAIFVDTDTTIPALLAAGVPVSSLGTGAISAATFAAGAIDSAAIAADAIKSSKIADDAIGADQIADDTITSAKIATDAIDADAIAANAITSVEIADGSLTAAKFAADCITSAKIADGAITTAKITADVSANVKMVNSSTTGVSGFLEAIGTVVEAVVHTGSSSSSIVSDTAALSSTDDAYVRRTLTFTGSSALANQSSVISDYVGATKTLTVSVAFTGVPAENDTFIIT